MATETNTTTHTPGPWKTNRGGVEGARGEPICAGQFNTSGGVTLEACRANLQLIATAPAMLEALKAAEWVMRSHIMPEHFDGHAAQALEQVRAAIAKATA
jgi:hypothetical protein